MLKKIKIGNFVYSGNRVIGLNEEVIPLDELNSYSRVIYDENEHDNLLYMHSWIEDEDGKRLPVTVLEGIGYWDPMGNDFSGIEFSKNLKIICSHDNEYCIFCKISLPDSVACVGPGAFKYSKFDKVIIPKNVKYIGKDAFAFAEEIVCLSPFLERIQGTNDFKRKQFIEDGISFCVFGDPSQKLAEAISFVEGVPDGKIVKKEKVNILGEEYDVKYAAKSLQGRIEGLWDFIFDEGDHVNYKYDDQFFYDDYLECLYIEI